MSETPTTSLNLSEKLPKYGMTNQELIILSSKCEIFLSFCVLLLELVIKCCYVSAGIN